MYLARIALAPALGPIAAEFGLSHAGAGVLFSVYFYAYTAMQIPAGVLGDRLGRKLLLVVGALTWGVGALLTSAAGSLAALAATRLVTGLGAGALFSNDRAVIATITPPAVRARGLGISFVGPGLGAGLGILLGGLLTDAWGWRAVFVAFAVPAFLAALLLRRFVAEPPRAASAPRPPLAPAFADRDLWLTYLGGMSAIYCLWVLGSWTPIVLQEAGVGSVGAAGVLSSVVGFAQVPGTIAAGFVTDRLVAAGRGRKTAMAGALALTGLFMALAGGAVALRAPVPVLLALVAGATFFMAASYAPMFGIWAALVPASALGATFGAGNTVSFVGSLVAPPLTGWIRDATGSFAAGFLVSAALLLGGTLLAMAVRPAFRLRNEERLDARS